MKTKFLVLFILSSICMLGSCSRNTIEYRHAVEEFSYVIKTIDGHRQWGLVANQATPEHMKEVIPCIYDSIYSVSGNLRLDDVFIAVKSGKRYAVKSTGEKLFNGNSFTDLNPVSQTDIYDSPYCRNQPLFKAVTEKGNWYISQDAGKTFFWGPHENFFVGVNGYSYKQNGKWGIMKADIKNKELMGLGTYETIYVPISEPQYDAVIEISGRNDNFWLVKKGSKWSAVNQNGTAKKYPASQIKALLNKKVTDWNRFNEIWTFEYQRVGNDVVGCIKLPR